MIGWIFQKNTPGSGNYIMMIEFTERHSRCLVQRWSMVGAFWSRRYLKSSRSTMCPPFALKTWLHSGRKLPFMGSVTWRIMDHTNLNFQVGKNKTIKQEDEGYNGWNGISKSECLFPILWGHDSALWAGEVNGFPNHASWVMVWGTWSSDAHNGRVQ